MSLQNKFLSKELSDKFWKEGLTLATAESCTAGNIAAMITAIPGSSHFYKGGIIAYALSRITPHAVTVQSGRIVPPRIPLRVPLEDPL